MAFVLPNYFDVRFIIIEEGDHFGDFEIAKQKVLQEQTETAKRKFTAQSTVESVVYFLDMEDLKYISN